MRLIHTSDVQLGAPFRFLGEKGAQHREQLRRTFARVVDLAIEAQSDLVLIAGDLFNHRRPRQSTVDFVAARLGSLRVPVCILPGNHDYYDDVSVYRTARFPDNVRILTDQPSIVEFPDLDVTIYGNPITSEHSHLSPLRGLTPTGSTRWHIAVAHGNLVRPDIVDPPRPIRPEEIRASGMDYVALGDWHAFADCSQGRVKAFYSGAPEPMAVDQQGAGSVALVELSEDGVHVRPERVGAITADQLTIDASGRSMADILGELRTRGDPNLMLRVTLSGLIDLETALDVDELEGEAASGFYHLECHDESHPQLASISAEDFPEELVVGKFVHLMLAKIENATSPAQRRQAEQALQLGVALLQGKRVL